MKLNLSKRIIDFLKSFSIGIIIAIPLAIFTHWEFFKSKENWFSIFYSFHFLIFSSVIFTFLFVKAVFFDHISEDEVKKTKEEIEKLTNIRTKSDAIDKLKKLKIKINLMIEWLSFDEGCTWITNFKNFDLNIEELINNDLNKEDITNLSKSIIEIYGGMGSFNDYYRKDLDKLSNNWIKRNGDSNSLATEIFELATDLRRMKSFNYESA